MKRRDIIRQIEAAGWYLLREGSKHTVYYNPDAAAPAKKLIEVPRHREINELLSKQILKDAGLLQ